MQQSKKIRAGVIGAAGYTGGETLRLLLHHPEVTVAFAHSRSSAGKPLYAVHPDLLGDTELTFSAGFEEADVVFLCMGHGESKALVAGGTIPAETRIIDLSQDFRLIANADLGDRRFVYGLPELNREQVRTAHHVANPGCFATAIQLGLLPLAKAGLLGEVHTTGITGSTGAGAGLSTTSHFSWRSNNIQAYKSLGHQHVAEIGQSLAGLQGNDKPVVHFVPWRGDFARGIYVTSVVKTELPADELQTLYRDFYADAPFTHLLPGGTVDLKQVVNTNKCILSLDQSGDQLAIHSAIDNLLKGASGQAVQNMNLMFGLPETCGLGLKAIAF